MGRRQKRKKERKLKKIRRATKPAKTGTGISASIGQISGFP